MAKAARQLSDDLVRLSENESTLLDGTLIAILPRILLRARLNTATGEIEVGSERAWAFLDAKVCAELLSGVALCAKVAAKKMPMDEAKRLGVVRIRADQKKLSALKNKKRRSSVVRNFPLHMLVRRLRALVIKTRGKLTLWNDPESHGPKRNASCGAKYSATPSVGCHSSEAKLQDTSPVSTFRNNARRLIFSIIFFPLTDLSFLGITCIYTRRVQQTETFARGASRSARKCMGRGMNDAALQHG